MKKFLSVLLLIAFTGVLFAQNVTFNDDIDPDLLDFVEELNGQDYLKETETINDIILKISKINPESQVIDFPTYTDRMIPTDTDEFFGLPLSEKLKIYKSNSKVQNEMVTAFMSVSPSTKNSPAYIEQAELVKELIAHSSILIDISTRIIISSNDYVGATISNLTEAQEYIEDAKVKASLLESQISLLNEALAYQEAKNQKAFIAGNILIPVVGITGLVPCIVLMANGNEVGYDLMWVDLGVTLGCELIWNGGHLMFKVW